MTLFRRVALGVGFLVLIFGVGVVVACEEPDSYVYTARKYDPVGECLEPYKPVEVVNGSSVSTACAPTCLTVSGHDTFVSVVCPPFPTIATPLAPDAAECIAALRAYDASACGADEDAEAEEEEEDADAAGSDGAADSSDDVTDSGADADGD